MSNGAHQTHLEGRVRARITSPVWVLRHLSGKARGLRILLVWKGRATPPDRMDRRPNRGSYSCASPKGKKSPDTHGKTSIRASSRHWI